jgi:PadR family transcriptional regulator
MVIDKEFVAATSAPITLSILNQADSYGYEIIQTVNELTGGELEWTEAMLYPVLHRLEKREFVRSYWLSAANGRKRKYYALTRLGRNVLKDKKRQWDVVANALKTLWGRNG